MQKKNTGIAKMFKADFLIFLNTPSLRTQTNTEETNLTAASLCNTAHCTNVFIKNLFNFYTNICKRQSFSSNEEILWDESLRMITDYVAVRDSKWLITLLS